MDIRVTTPAGGVYIIKDATAFGPDAVIGHLNGDPNHSIFRIAEDDKVEELKS